MRYRNTAITSAALAVVGGMLASTAPAQAAPARGLGETSLVTVLGADG